MVDGYDIRLRALEPEDAELLYMADNEESAVVCSDMSAPLSLHLLRDYAANYDADPFRAGQLRLVAETGSTGRTGSAGRVVGLLDFYDISARDRHAKIGVLILPEYRGFGLGSALVEAAKAYAWGRLGLESLLALVHSDNPVSLRLFFNAGFEDCGLLRRWHFAEGDLRDVRLLQAMKHA